MKFLCVSCDEGMQIEATMGPQEGSLQATFVCPRCRHKIVLLTNPWETQLVQTMGVRIGGRAASASPYEQVLNSLVRPPQDSSPQIGDEPTSAGCPFAGMIGPAEEAGSAGIQWTEDAKGRVDRIPSFIRPMVQKAIERYATEQGYQVITDAVMDEARSRLGM
jgi:Proto-chlorophyllide reductase 57 kD subunit